MPEEAKTNLEKVVQVKFNIQPPTNNGSADNSIDGEGDVTALADVFVVTCRQLAYEKEMYNIVNLIDYKQGCLLKWLKPPNHKVRLTKSARLANEAALKEPVLPPDRSNTSKRLISRKRYRKQRNSLRSTALSPPTIHVMNAAEKTPQEESLSQLPTDIGSSQRPSSTCDAESTVVVNDSSRRMSHTARHRQSLTPRVHLTKTAIVRQRENLLSTKTDQLQLRHPESLEVFLTRPSTRQRTEFDRSTIKSEQRARVLSSKPLQPKINSSSYGHHLPFRRKPIIFDSYVEQMVKKSLHGYQHSTDHVSQRKFVGRI